MNSNLHSKFRFQTNHSSPFPTQEPTCSTVRTIATELVLDLRLGRRTRLENSSRRSKGRRFRQSTVHYTDGQEQPVDTELQFARMPSERSESTAEGHIEPEPVRWTAGRAGCRSNGRSGVRRAVVGQKRQGSVHHQ